MWVQLYKHTEAEVELAATQKYAIYTNTPVVIASMVLTAKPVTFSAYMEYRNVSTESCVPYTE